MDAYTQHLLGMAYTECEKHSLSLRLWPYGPGIFVVVERMKPESQEYEVVSEGDGATAAEALSSLLTDLGVEVPERPSERQVNAAYLSAVPLADAAPCSFAVGRLRDLYAREPLTVLALLEDQ